VEEGDSVVSVDGVPAHGLSVGQVTNLIRGTPANNTHPVHLVFYRETSGMTVHVDLPRPPRVAELPGEAGRARDPSDNAAVPPHLRARTTSGPPATARARLESDEPRLAKALARTGFTSFRHEFASPLPHVSLAPHTSDTHSHTSSAAQSVAPGVSESVGVGSDGSPAHPMKLKFASSGDSLHHFPSVHHDASRADSVRVAPSTITPPAPPATIAASQRASVPSLAIPTEARDTHKGGVVTRINLSFAGGGLGTISAAGGVGGGRGEEEGRGGEGEREEHRVTRTRLISREAAWLLRQCVERGAWFVYGTSPAKFFREWSRVCNGDKQSASASSSAVGNAVGKRAEMMPHTAVLRWLKDAGLGAWHADFHANRVDGRSLAAMHEVMMHNKAAFSVWLSSLQSGDTHIHTHTHTHIHAHAHTHTHTCSLSFSLSLSAQGWRNRTPNSTNFPFAGLLVLFQY